jgi:hypothetical protein
MALHALISHGRMGGARAPLRAIARFILALVFAARVAQMSAVNTTTTAVPVVVEGGRL